jgi:hypothetical protein
MFFIYIFSTTNFRFTRNKFNISLYIPTRFTSVANFPLIQALLRTACKQQTFLSFIHSRGLSDQEILLIIKFALFRNLHAIQIYICNAPRHNILE